MGVAPAAGGPKRRLLDRYEIRRVLGRGGMGVVYEAYDPRLDRVVAIKSLASNVFGEGELERFEREARLCGKVDSPYMARAFDVVSDASGLYLVMERLEGETLHEFAGRQRDAAPHEIVLAMIDACHGLTHAHGVGVLHRDLKPQNIFVCSGTPRRAKLLDFGVAKDTGSDRTALTANQNVLGTLSYMAPEYLAGRGCDVRSDVFSLGLALYWSLTGRFPWDGARLDTGRDGYTETAPIELCELRPDLSTLLVNAVMTAIEREPRFRHQSAEELRVALEQSLAELTPVASAAAVSPRVPSMHSAHAQSQPLETGATTPLAAPLGAPAPLARRGSHVVWALVGGGALAAMSLGAALARRAPSQPSEMPRELVSAPRTILQPPPAAAGAGESMPSPSTPASSNPAAAGSNPSPIPTPTASASAGPRAVPRATPVLPNTAATPPPTPRASAWPTASGPWRLPPVLY